MREKKKQMKKLKTEFRKKDHEHKNEFLKIKKAQKNQIKVLPKKK